MKKKELFFFNFVNYNNNDNKDKNTEKHYSECRIPKSVKKNVT